MIYLLIIVWCVLLWYRTKDFKPVVDDQVLWSKPVENTLIDRLYGAHTVDNLAIDRAISLSLHCLMSLLVAAVFNPVAGLLFSVHPTTMQVAVWLNGKRFSIAGILSVLAYSMSLCIAVLPLILAFQPIGLPAFMFVFKHFSWWMVLPIALLLPFTLPYIKNKLKSRGIETIGTDMQAFHPRKLIFAVKSLWVYFRQCMFPERNVMYSPDYYGIGLDDDGKKRMYSLDFAFYAGLVAIAFIAVNFNSGMWWFALFAFQWLNWVTLTQTFADRYMYIALVGACVYLSSTPIALVMIGYFACRSWDNLRQYDGIINFLKYNNDVSPENPHGAVFLASTWLKDGRFNLDAYVVSKECVLKHPRSCIANILYARCVYKLGNKIEAVKYMERALQHTIKERPEMVDNINEEIIEMKK